MPEGLRPKNFVLAPAHLEHVDHCPASRVYVSKRPPMGHGQWYGIAVHLFLEKAMQHGREAALVYIKQRFPRFVKGLEKIAFDTIPQGDPEVQFLIDPQLHQGYRGAWTDADPEQHIAARADLVLDFSHRNPRGFPGLLMGADNWIVDYKTGTTAGKQSPASVQMRTLAVARWLELGRQPRLIGAAIAAIALSGTIVWITELFRHSQLLEESLRLRRLHLKVLETRAEWRDEHIEPEFNAGAWCMKCSAQTACAVFKAYAVVQHAQRKI